MELEFAEKTNICIPARHPSPHVSFRVLFLSLNVTDISGCLNFSVENLFSCLSAKGLANKNTIKNEIPRTIPTKMPHFAKQSIVCKTNKIL